MKIIDPGHIYEVENPSGGTQRLTFIKRGGGAVQYPEEWPEFKPKQSCVP